jgi:hypothetical protein
MIPILSGDREGGKWIGRELLAECRRHHRAADE